MKWVVEWTARGLDEWHASIVHDEHPTLVLSEALEVVRENSHPLESLYFIYRVRNLDTGQTIIL